ncbi:MAG: DUF3618 domain-containing protein [Sphingomonas sp.]|nr:DUF3618 domain-containing protein [Sphingomonas sp.]MDX3885444.1 DUF3618 domain-containing protein [Sphingomonas sp.]
MIGDEADIANARARAAAARARLGGTLGEIQARLNPKALAREAWDELREHGEELAAEALAAAKEKPARTAAIAGGVALFLARKPIVRGIMHLLAKRDEAGTDEETAAAPNGSGED